MLSTLRRYSALSAIASISCFAAGCGHDSFALPTSRLAAPDGFIPTAPSQATPPVNVAFQIQLPASAAAHRSASISATSSAGSSGAPTVVTCSDVCGGTMNAFRGSNTFTVQIFAAQNGSGAPLASGSTTQTVTPGQTNDLNLTFNPVVSSLAISLGKSATAGSAATIPLTVNAYDANGNTIIGPSRFVDANGNPITITIADSDMTGATSPSQTLVAHSTPVMTLLYNGLAIAPATITASASGIGSTTAIFKPALHPITTGAGSSAQIDLSPDKTTATLTASEVGWTNSPFNKSLKALPASGCKNIASVSAVKPDTFDISESIRPAKGTCTLTVSDFTGGRSATVKLTFTPSQ